MRGSETEVIDPDLKGSGRHRLDSKLVGGECLGYCYDKVVRTAEIRPYYLKRQQK